MTDETTEKIGDAGASSTPPKNTAPREENKSQTAADVGLTRGAGAGAGPDDPRPLPPNGSEAAGLQSDIAHILQEVKLPERHEFHAKGDVPQAIAVPTPIPQSGPVIPEAKAAEPPPRPEQPKETTAQGQKTDEIVVPLHTLKDDLQHVVQEKKMSVVRAVALEEDRHARQAMRVEPFPKPKRNYTSIIIAIVLLFVLGGAALGGVYYVSIAQQAGLHAAQPQQSILFSEQTLSFPLDPNTPGRILKEQLSGVRTSTRLSVGAVARVVPTVQVKDPASGQQIVRPATASEFLGAISSDAPDELIRALSDDFFFGIHAIGGNAPIMVFKVQSYDHAFAGMLNWEGTMGNGLAPMFTPVPLVFTNPDGTTSQNTFTDDVMRNYDVRELKDAQGAVGMYYSFPTRKLLIIAENPNSFVEILSRLRAQGEL